jgi:3-deoxy-D-manno-octulosonate 8-phosphate phosphatase (KDO 8-P phosphatase)
MNSTFHQLTGALARLRVLLLDCDGVLTQGEKYYSLEGVELLRFHARDGFGIRQISPHVRVIIISRNQSQIIVRRAEDLGGITFYGGITDKAECVRQILADTGLQPDEAGFIGDDIFDIDVHPFVGVLACPRAAVFDVRQASDLVLSADGGDGAVREIADLINLARLHVASPWREQPPPGQFVRIGASAPSRSASSVLYIALLLDKQLSARSIRCEFDGYVTNIPEAAHILLAPVGDHSFRLLINTTPPTLSKSFLFIDPSDTVLPSSEFASQVITSDFQELCDMLYSTVLQCWGSDQLKKKLYEDGRFVKVCPVSLVEREIEWQKAMCERHIGNTLIGRMVATDNQGEIGGYATERIVGFSLREIVINDRLLSLADPGRVASAFEDFLEHLATEFHQPIDTDSVNVHDLIAYYRSKLIVRTDILRHLFGGTHADLIHRGQALGAAPGTSDLPDPLEMFDSLAQWQTSWPQIICPNSATLIHGDPHFGNLMFGRCGSDQHPHIYMIDGKNQHFPGLPPAVGDTAYDYGKLLQSVECQIDMILGDSASRGRHIFPASRIPGSEASPTEALYALLAPSLEHAIERASQRLEDPYPGKRSRLLLALHLITMSPCLPQLSRDAMAYFYAQGVNILRVLLDTL